MPEVSPARRGLRWWLAEAAIVGLFVVLGVAHQCGRTMGLSPFPLLGSDAANIASFVAAEDHPGAFTGDGVLAEEANFRVYSTVHLPLLSALARRTGDYGTAFECTLWAHVALQGIGFYLLGRVLFGLRAFAVLFSLLTLLPVTLKPIETWGVFDDPIPRITFQALLPFVLAGCLRWGASPWAWLLGLLATGGLIYVHPVSAPGCGLALWFAAWAFLPSVWSWRRRVAWMLFLGVAFLAATAPFVAHYLSHFAHGAPVGASYEEVREAMRTRMVEDFFDAPTGLGNFLRTVPAWWWVVGLVGAAATCALRRDRRPLAAIGLWLLGLLLASVALPWADQALAARMRQLPRQVDLIRGLRYVVPLLLLFVVWPLAEAWRVRGRVRALTVLVPLVALFLGWQWGLKHKPQRVVSAVAAWLHGEGFPRDAESRSLCEAMQAVRDNTLAGEPLLCTHESLAVRYFALRPVVWAYKDGGILLYTNHSGLLRWQEAYQDIMRAHAERPLGTEFVRLHGIAARLGARYLFTAYAIGAPRAAAAARLAVVWSNGEYTLLRVLP